jgi:hypothetical protein
MGTCAPAPSRGIGPAVAGCVRVRGLRYHGFRTADQAFNGFGDPGINAVGRLGLEPPTQGL